MQKVTYWGVSSIDGYAKEQYLSPVVLDGYWEQKEHFYLDEFSREKKVAVNQVFFRDLEFDIGGFLYLGESSVSDPKSQPKALVIVAVGYNTNLKNTWKRVKVSV